MPMSALRPIINTDAKANPAAINMGLIVLGGMVTKWLIFTNKMYTKAITTIAIGDDLIILGTEYKGVNEWSDFIDMISVYGNYSKLIKIFQTHW